MGISDTLYGSRVLLRSRGTVGTSQVNLNTLGSRGIFTKD